MKTTLVSITTDTIPLDGLWHEPDSETPRGTVRGAVLLFHGNTMNFYTGVPRFLPPVLTRLGYACLAFNRRGHDILAIRNSRAAEGAAFQTYAEAIEDNGLARTTVPSNQFWKYMSYIQSSTCQSPQSFSRQPAASDSANWTCSGYFCVSWSGGAVSVMYSGR